MDGIGWVQFVFVFRLRSCIHINSIGRVSQKERSCQNVKGDTVSLVNLNRSTKRYKVSLNIDVYV